jgi:hypothetical protein
MFLTVSAFGLEAPTRGNFGATLVSNLCNAELRWMSETGNRSSIQTSNPITSWARHGLALSVVLRELPKDMNENPLLS